MISTFLHKLFPVKSTISPPNQNKGKRVMCATLVENPHKKANIYQQIEEAIPRNFIAICNTHHLWGRIMSQKVNKANAIIQEKRLVI